MWHIRVLCTVAKFASIEGWIHTHGAPYNQRMRKQMIAPLSMNNESLGKLIRERATSMLEDELGYWKFQFGESLVLVVTDQSHNRMRVMTPVAKLDAIADDEWVVLMSANFDRALDARYCVNGGILWSAFIHPLQELQTDQLLDALNQVVTLAKNYGASYASSNLVYGG